MKPTEYAVPPAGLGDDASDHTWVVSESGATHAIRPQNDPERILTYCGRAASKLLTIELFDDDVCQRCIHMLGKYGFRLDYCGHCGAFVLGYHRVAGYHFVQRVGTAGVYSTNTVCPGTWQRWDAAYIPQFEIGAPRDPTHAPALGRPGEQGRHQGLPSRAGAQRHRRLRTGPGVRVEHPDLGSAPTNYTFRVPDDYGLRTRAS